MLKPGASAPDIVAETTQGERFVLSEQTGLCTVIYFFPKAFTPVCRRQAEMFRDNHAELAMAGANLVGISVDRHATQCEFAESVDLPFPLIADADKAIAKAYDVLWPVVALPRRVTFVVAPNRLILAAFRDELDVVRHRDQTLRFVNSIHHAHRA